MRSTVWPGGESGNADGQRNRTDSERGKVIMMVCPLRRPQHRMYLAAFLLDFSVAVGFTAMPFFVIQQLNGGAALSGTVGAVQMAVYAFACLASAAMLSRARNPLVWAVGGVLGFAVVFTLVPWVRSPGLCIVVASAPFLGLALAWPAMQAWLGLEPDPEIRARRLAGFNTATAFGFTLSPLLTGPLYDADFRLPFALLTVLSLAVAGLVLSLAPRNPRISPAPRDERHHEETASRNVTPGLLYASWAATFTANGLFAAVRSVYPLRVETLAAEGSLLFFPGIRPAFFDALGPATAYSWLAFTLSLWTVICFAIMGRTSAWQGRYALLAAGQMAAALAFVLLSCARSVTVMAACFAVVGFNYGLCFFASIYYSLAHARTRHRNAAINEGVLGAGGFAGGLAFGHLAEAIGVPAAFQYAPLLAAAAIGVQLLLLRTGPRRPQS